MDAGTTQNLYRDRAEQALVRWLPPPEARPARLHQAMRYSVGAGGKRLRPILLLAAGDLWPARADPTAAAAAVEMLHSYSLVHDDLPCMDDSPLRRGQPSCHVQFDETTAVLAGDALLTEAFRLLAEAYGDDPALAVALIRELAEAAGSRSLVGGQMEDTCNSDRPLAAEDLDFIHQHKTAALLSASLAMGGLLTEAPAGAVEALRRIGRDLGLAFQIVDDLLDATGDEATLGKTAGRDAAQRKRTYVQVHGLEASRRRVHQLTGAVVAGLRGLPADTAFLQALAAALEHRVR